MNYYNEHDRYAAAWLRELIAAGAIPNGVVDERSITDITHDDLHGYTQVHLFAGIGGWAHALRIADIPDTRPLWTGSPPCQPFSIAGKGLAEKDPRHLFPHMARLIRKCRPPVVLGEQVAGADGLAWLTGVCASLEEMHYAFGAANLPAGGIAAPHLRERLYFVAHAGHEPEGRRPRSREEEGGRALSDASGRSAGSVGDSECSGLLGDTRQRSGDQSAISGEWLGNTDHEGPQEWGQRFDGLLDEAGRQTTERSARLPGFWSDHDIVYCRDRDKVIARRIEPGTFPLVARVSGRVVPGGDPSEAWAQATTEARVMRLRGYGNAICAPLAAEFIKAVFESI